MQESIIPLREIIGNYNIPPEIHIELSNYTLERDNRELQLGMTSRERRPYYTLERDNRELQRAFDFWG